MTCSTCQTTIEPLEAFPGKLCVTCWSETAEGQRMVTAEELVKMWGG
jgi:hypothetical protein